MAAPDISQHNPEPAYLRELIAQIGLSQRAIARLLGIDETLFRRYITRTENASYRTCPYLVQYAMEQWAAQSSNRPTNSAADAR